ncbi:MAG: phenylalanine--tRNA ligase subunit beta [Planctomycetota bacterium]
MIVSWNWLKRYVSVTAPREEVEQRLTMSGLNHEKSVASGGDWAIDLDVTSNRPDCLGHLGIAREVAVLFGVPLQVPHPQPASQGPAVSEVAAVRIEAERLCTRYAARLIRDVKVGPSPAWLQDLLLAIGINPVNNVVDCTNFVMFECGQPLHAFDFSQLRGGQIVVREPRPGERLRAIDHREYDLEPGMCVIADGQGPVAIAGVMGGAESEVSASTRDVLIESAWFDPLAVRTTARKLALHSPSSYRFERGVDWQGADWASLRCCELILQTAGGQLAPGVIDVQTVIPQPHPIQFRLERIARVLGIEIPKEFVRQTFLGLGLRIEQEQGTTWTLRAPAWRRDLEREVDLIEEVGRIYGYDKVPDEVPVPMAASYRPRANRVGDKVRKVLTGCGFDEAMTPSLVPQIWADSFSPWTDCPPLVSNQPMLGVLEKASQNIGPVSFVRRSLVPNLLEAKRINEYRSNDEIELFEIAKVYLPQNSGIPHDPLLCGLVSSRDFAAVKGVLETLVQTLHPAKRLETQHCEHDLLDISQSAQLTLDGERWGWLGKVSPWGRKLFGLRQDAVVAEFDLALLEGLAVLVPQHQELSEYPPVTRDFNFVLDNDVRWASLESTVRLAAGPMLEAVRYLETFRDEAKDGPGKKRLLLSVVLRSASGTLTGQQLEEVSQQIIAACDRQLGARVLA